MKKFERSTTIIIMLTLGLTVINYFLLIAILERLNFR